MAPEAIPALLDEIDELLAEPTPSREPATLARLERTLTDPEVDTAHEAIVALLIDHLPAQRR